MAFSALLTLIVAATGQETSKTTTVLNSFAGDFVLAGATGDLRFDPHSATQPTLTVRMTSGGLEVQRTSDGHDSVTLPVDGTQARYTDESGHSATAKLNIRRKSVEITRDIQPAGRFVLPTHSVERWDLSSDGNVLKICGHADSGIRGVTQFRISGCQIFKRK